MRQFFEFGYQIFAHFSSILHEVFLLENLKNSYCSGTSEVISAECGAELTIYRLKLWTNKHSAKRIAIGDALSHSDHVGTNAGVLMSEEFARTAVAALYFVENEHGVVLITLAAQCLEEVVSWYLHAAHALNAFHYHSAHIAGCQFAGYGVYVVERKEGYMAVIVDWSHYLGIVGGLNGKRSASVECLIEGYHAATSVVERCQFQRILIGFGARIDEKQLIIVVAARLAEQVSQALLQTIDHRVAVEHEVLGLML